MPEYKLRIIVEGQDKASGPLGNVASSLQRIGEFAAGNLLASGLKAGGRALVGMGREALGAYADFERLGLSLETLVAREALNTGAASTMAEALAGAGEQTQSLIGWIEDLAVLSPFNQSDIAKSFRLTMAYGFTADEAQRLTSTMVDFAAGSGATGDSMQRIALALGQIKARGKLAGQEIMQLTEQGIPVRQILAKAFNVTTAELEEMITAGISADRAIEAIISSLETDFAGAAERQAGTFSGLISSLEDLREIGLRDFFGPMFQEAQPYLQAFVDTLTDPAVKEAIGSIGESLGVTLGGALDAVSGKIGAFATKWGEAEAALGKNATFMQTITKMLGGEYTVKLETVFAEEPPPLPAGWGASMSPLEIAGKMTTIDATGATTTPSEVIMSGVVRTIDAGGAQFEWTSNPITGKSMGSAVRWDGNSILFDGMVTKVSLGALAFDVDPISGAYTNVTWDGQQFNFKGVVEVGMKLAEQAAGWLEGTGASNPDVMLLKKLFTPGSLAEAEFVVNIKTSVAEGAAKMLSFFGIGGDGETTGKGGPVKASLAIGDDGSLGRFEAAINSLTTWPATFASTVSVGVEGMAQELDRAIGNIKAPGWVTAITGLFDGSTTITIPEFVWPELPNFEWPEEIFDFAWPKLPEFTWPELPQFHWPKLPSFSWPNVGLPTWPSPAEILGRLLGIGGARSSGSGIGQSLGPVGAGGGPERWDGSNALGSSYWRGGLTMVGEHGAELVNLPRGSRIHNAFETQRMAGGAQPLVVNVNVAQVGSDIDVQSMAYRVADVIQRRQRAFA